VSHGPSPRIDHSPLRQSFESEPFKAGVDSVGFTPELTDDELRGPAALRRPGDVKREIAAVLGELRSGGLETRTEHNIESFLCVADAFEADGLLVQAVDCLEDLAGRLLELAAARAARPNPNGLIETEADLLAYRDSHNVHVLDDKYVTGAQPTERGYQWLQQKGVTTVVNLRLADAADRAIVERLGMRYVHIPWPDECSPRLDQVDELLGAVDATPGRVFQHCLRGIGRDMTMAGCYLIARHGHSAADVIRRGTAAAPRWASDQHQDEETAEPVQFALLRALDERRIAPD